MNKANYRNVLIVLFFLTLSGNIIGQQLNKKEILNGRWSKEKIQTWYDAQPWLSGCNYIPSNAINQIEMWQSETFDAAIIDKELGWAEELGFNTSRVFLSSVVWKHDKTGFKKRINKFLTICSKHNIRPMFVFFDDCWNQESHIGKQPDPISGVHNSGWMQDPSASLRKDTTKLFLELELYVKDILTAFHNDKRILMWDLYNEPGNSKNGITSLPLLKKVFKWAREVNPSQPLTAGEWTPQFSVMNNFQFENSDIITYHSYASANEHVSKINDLKKNGRPLMCTEYMARKMNSRFENIMPMLKKNKIGAINWGFVAGKTNTIFAWDEPTTDIEEPKLWFHDIYRQDHTPFDVNEINVIKKINNVPSGVKLINESDFKAKIGSKEVSLFTLTNNTGMVAQITNFGGRVVALWTQDRYGKFDDIVAGCATYKKYIKANEVYLGALIGRYGNRIANGKFNLDDKSFQIPVNNGKNTLHGGPLGFHNVIWDARKFKNSNNEDALELKYLSPDGEEGFPGNLLVTVVYTLTNQNELKIEYSASTDRTTVINLTHHSFFNLFGFSNGNAQSINSHILKINALSYNPTDNGLIPTGNIEHVKGTPMDFSTAHEIGKRVDEPFPALLYGKGYDHNWILDKKNVEMTEAAVIYEPSNGRQIRVITTEPALQFYGGNFFKGKDKGKYGEVYMYRTSFVLETQHYPDSPNNPNFPTTVLRPGEAYNHVCIYKFEIK
jgi:galactose mutarotase-like enzyme